MMKESKILRIISYVLIPVLVAMMVLSILTNEMQNSESIYNNETEYFSTDQFVSDYMSCLASYTYQLIHHNEDFPLCYDGEVQISYLENVNNYNHLNIQNCYFLIRYQNKALTNVEMTSETNTLEKILIYISQNENSKKANILAGNIETDSDVLANKAIKYFNYFEDTYYTLEEQEEMPEYEVTDKTEKVSESVTKRKYIETNIQDFMIYSSYQEKLVLDSNEIMEKEFLKNYENLGENVCVIVPVCLSLLLVIVIYLVIAIGHTKGKEEIDLNDLDKIPYEILWFVAFILWGICIGLLNVESTANNMDLFVSMILVDYMIVYSTCAILFDTTIKRIKAKTIMKNTLCYRIWKWLIKIMRKIKNKIVVIWNNVTASMGITKKLIFVVIGYIIIAFILLATMQLFGLFLALIIGVVILYQIIKEINCFLKIENHLKEMYEGKHPEALKNSDFTSEFQNMIIYINDISSGFENAIQEGIKSERLKTELITNVSHDIKTPLTSIINYVDLLKKEKIENEKAKEYIGILDKKSQRLKKLMEDLIEASKASSGNVKLNMEKINVVELIKQSTGEFEDKFKAKDLKIITNIPEEEVYILADNRYMYRVIENIFSNVAKYALENSRVYVDVDKKGEKVYIIVKNISKEVLNISEEELMRRFVRGDKSRTTEGSGLGISISKSLTELQNGTLKIKIDGDLFKVELCFTMIEQSGHYDN